MGVQTASSGFPEKPFSCAGSKSIIIKIIGINIIFSFLPETKCVIFLAKEFYVRPYPAFTG